jgi:WD40 repeat protein
MKLFFLFTLFISTFLLAEIQKPLSSYIANGGVIDLVYQNNKLYAATNASCVDIFDIKSKKLLESIKISKIKDFMGDEINSKIYSVDVLDDAVLILSQGNKGFRRLHLFSNGKLQLLIPTSEHLYISEAKFIDSHTVLLALLGSDLISYDITEKKENWHVQVSQSKFSHFVLSKDKREVVLADESGDLHLLDTRDAKVLKVLSGENLDNVFKVDYKGDIVASAGQDRRVVIYNLKTGYAYYKLASFLIYSVGLSPSGKLVGYASDENNNVTVFNTSSKKDLGTYGDNKMTLSAIVFLNESEFLVSCDSKIINRYKIKE